jgi:hypothetical protein
MDVGARIEYLASELDGVEGPLPMLILDVSNSAEDWLLRTFGADGDCTLVANL